LSAAKHLAEKAEKAARRREMLHCVQHDMDFRCSDVYKDS
jgi:hypothetical protein